jgi:hypothetical protein
MAHRSNPTVDAIASPVEPAASGVPIRSIALALTVSLAVIAAVTTAALFAFDRETPLAPATAEMLRDWRLVPGIDPSVPVIEGGPVRAPVSAAMLRDLQMVAGIDPSVPVIVEDTVPQPVTAEMLRDLQMVAGIDPSVPVIIDGAERGTSTAVDSPPSWASRHE